MTVPRRLVDPAFTGRISHKILTSAPVVSVRPTLGGGQGGSPQLTGVTLAADRAEHLVVGPRGDDAVGGGQGQPLGGAVEQLQLPDLVLLLGLLPPQSHLRRHHPLPLDDEDAFLTGAVLEPAVALVTFEPGQHAVVPAPRTLGGPLERGPGLGHRSPHVKVRGPVAIHSARHKCVRGDARGGVKWSQRWMDPHWHTVDRGEDRRCWLVVGIHLSDMHQPDTHSWRRVTKRCVKTASRLEKYPREEKKKQDQVLTSDFLVLQEILNEI